MGFFSNKLIEIEEKIFQLESILLELKKDLRLGSSSQEEDPKLMLVRKIETYLLKLKRNLNLE